MNYLLDTCIISKLRKIKKHPDEKLENWIAKHAETSFFLSVLTIGEIQSGISKLSLKNKAEKHQKQILENWFLEELIPRFNNRLLFVDLEVVLVWGRLSGELKKKGVNIPVIDELIAATAIVNNLTLITENIKDFAETGTKLFNPWADFDK